MTVLDDEAQVRGMLAPLSRVEPVSLRARKRSRRPVLIASLLAAALIASSIAIAEGINPFAGIGAANHTRTSRDILAPAVVAQIRAINQRQARPNNPSQVGILPDTSHLLGQLTGGRNIYVVKTTNPNGVLCAIVTRHARLQEVTCGDGLTPAHPLTVGTTQTVKEGPHATRALSYGLARDGITSVSFTAHGHTQTVAVKSNVWFYEGNSNVLNSITVHYANGTTRTITH